MKFLLYFFLKIDINNIGRKITNEVLNIQLYIPAEPARIIKGIIPKVFRIKISKNRLKELEILQTQGRANSGIYIKEVLKLATTEIELEELDTQQLLNSVDTLDASVSVCSLLRICGQIDKALEGY